MDQPPAERVSGRAAPVETDCLACGACCLSDQADYIRVFAVDQDRLDDQDRALTQLVDGQRCMRFVGGRCAALEVDRAARRVRCVIYPRRPDCCRWLQAGSAACRELQATAGHRRPPH